MKVPSHQTEIPSIQQAKKRLEPNQTGKTKNKEIKYIPTFKSSKENGSEKIIKYQENKYSNLFKADFEKCVQHIQQDSTEINNSMVTPVKKSTKTKNELKAHKFYVVEEFDNLNEYKDIVDKCNHSENQNQMFVYSIDMDNEGVSISPPKYECCASCNNKLDPTDEYFNPQVSNKETNTIFSSDKPEACFNEYDDYAKINDWEFGNRKKCFTITEVESDDSIKEIV